MKPAFFPNVATREAFDHGRSQARLEIARKALQEIHEIATGKKRGKLLAIEVRARIALDVTRPDPDTVY